MKTYTHVMPAHWASALINNDRSGLSDTELKDFEAFFYENRELQNSVSCSEETTLEQFTYYTGKTRLTDCLEYSFLKGGENERITIKKRL